MASRKGLEPLTFRFVAECSDPIELPGYFFILYANLLETIIENRIPTQNSAILCRGDTLQPF